MRSWPGRHGRVHRAGSRQHGFIALIALLVVVVIVCIAIGAMLRKAESPRADRPAAFDAGGGSQTPAPPSSVAAPPERARAVEETLRQQASENERRIEQQVDSDTR